MKENLKQTQNYLHAVFHSIPSMLIITNQDGIIVNWNSAAEKFTGISTDQAVSKSLWKIVPFFDELKPSFNKALAERSRQNLKRINIKLDEEKYLDISICPLTILDGYDETPGAVIQIDDVTETVRKDEYLRQAQKMDTVGILAAGLAHDFNNVIGGIKATVTSMDFSIETANELQKLKNELKNDIDTIQESIHSGSEMVDRLLSLSSKEEPPFLAVDLNEQVLNIVKICKKSFDKSIEIKTSLDEEKSIIKAYPTQIEQALLNLCINAAHAMTIMQGQNSPQGGTLNISVKKIYVGKHIASIMPDITEGDYWVTGISDTGVGMDRETVSKIFDPFFTTKGKYHGRGLGLSMVYNIVRQHGGFIDVYSEPGLGSTFFIFLPVPSDS